VQRVAFIMRLKEGQQQEYIKRHKNIWPEILSELKISGVQNMSIFMAGLQLFLFMEVADYVKAARVLAESPDSQRWEVYMAPIMEDASGEPYDPANAYPEGLPEVFHWQAVKNNDDCY